MSARPRRALAAVLVELRAPLVLAEIELPRELAAGQVLVRIVFSGVCGSQLGEIDGVKGEDRHLPHLLGHEASGVVLEAGPGVRRVREGDRVVLHWRRGAGIDAEPPRLSWARGALNAGLVTTFSELSVVSESRLTPIPADSDMEIAALFGCAVTTGFGVIQGDAQVRAGESVVVFGAGGVGLSMVQAAALVAAHPVVAVDRHARRLELAGRLGAEHLVRAEGAAAGEAIRAALGGEGADVFIDNTGSPAVIELGYRLVKPQGRVILVGVPRAGDDVRVHTLPLHFGKILRGSHGGSAAPEADIPRLLRLARAGRLELRRLITDRYPLARINEAISDMRAGAVAGRCLIEP